MTHHRKLICGGMFLVLATTHVGCAGSGLKNMFTRNETDGYHSLDELEADESGYEDETPSLAARLASWRPFGTLEPGTEETYAAGELDSSEVDATNPARSPRFPTLAFSKKDNVAPDPFLSEEPEHVGRSESPASDTAADQKIANTDNKPATTGYGFGTERNLSPVTRESANAGIEQVQQRSESKDKDADEFALLVASRKPDSVRSKSDDEDNSLEKRFEQHFLLNSVGSVAGSDDNRATATKVASKKRDLSDIADRQIDHFDYLLAADPAPNVKNPGFQRNSDSTGAGTSKHSDSVTEQSANSLFAFDRLIAHEGSDGTHQATLVAHTITQSPETKAAAADVNVADAEALFGAAAARQILRTKPAEDLVRSELPDRSSSRSSAWSQSPEDSEGFQWTGSPSVKPVSQPKDNSSDASGAFARYVQSNSDSGKRKTHNTAFGAPPVSAGNVESDDCSVLETSDMRVSNASASTADHRIIMADYGIARPNVVVHPASSEASAAGDAHFTMAPVAPVPALESSASINSQAIRPGLVQSLSTRNWLLLIGGIIVIALLFAPGRTKSLTMNG